MCLCPICIPNPSSTCFDLDRQGKVDSGLVDVMLDNYSKVLYVPCRHCIECIKARSAEWSARLRTELEYEMEVLGHDCYFVTLTVAPAYMHEFVSDGVVDKSKCSSVLGKFFRTLKDSYRCAFRHWCIAEFGEKYGRLHFHCLFFNPPVSLETDGVHLHYSKNGQRMGSSPVLRRFWKYGFNDSGKVGSVAAGCYVSKYLVKGSSRSRELPPIITSKGVGKNALSVARSMEVLKRCVLEGYYNIPIVYGRYQKQYQIPYRWMSAHGFSRWCVENGYDVWYVDCLVRYCMAESIGLAQHFSHEDLNPANRRVRLENIVGESLTYKHPVHESENLWLQHLFTDASHLDFFYGTDLEPF